jgi:hypothetical protein
MSFGEGSGCNHWQAGGLGQRGERVIGLGDAHAIADDDHWLLRREQRLGSSSDAQYAIVAVQYLRRDT